MKIVKTVLLSMVSVACSSGLMAQNNAPKLNAHNIDEVIKAMTLEEKATLLVGDQNENQSSAVAGVTKKLVLGAAGTTTAIPRLGIPAVVLTDGPAGVRITPTRPGETKTYYATGFPIGTCLASSWNVPLVEKVGKAIGNEVLSYGCDVILGPGMNIHRSPLCGRNFEYFSEDPVLSGLIAAAYVRGVQSEGAGTSIKHFAVNSQETMRTSLDERVSQRALREIYLKNFEIAVKLGNPWTVMASYNKVNGTFTQESYDLLTKILRDDWGFKGLVMTDWTGMRNTAAQVYAGDDLLEPGGNSQVKDIIEKVKSGKIDIKDVDRNVRRVLELAVKSVRFRDYKFSNDPDLKAHAAVTRQSAKEGMVLLKNEDNALPLKDIKTVALFGVNSYDFLSGGVGSGHVNTPYTIDMVAGLKNAGIEATKDLTSIYRKYITYADEKFQMDRDPTQWYFEPLLGHPKYAELDITPRCIGTEVNKSEAAIITFGRQAGEGYDRSIDGEFNLSKDELNLLTNVCDAYHQAGKKVIVVINSGSVIETSSWKARPDAILVAWQPGEEGGNSIADILTGKTCPSGKLTMTWPIAATDHYAQKNFPEDMTADKYAEMKNWGTGIPGYDYTNHEEDIYVGYRYFDTFGKNVSYPFGYGLSYTTFAYGKPSVKLNGNQIELTVSVKNTGSYSGKEVAEVYVTAPKGQLEKPSQELKAFAKTKELKPGESETLKMIINKIDLASFDEAASQWVVDAGNYLFKVGASSRDIKGTAVLKLSGMTEKVSDALKPQVKLNILSQKK